MEFEEAVLLLLAHLSVAVLHLMRVEKERKTHCGLYFCAAARLAWHAFRAVFTINFLIGKMIISASIYWGMHGLGLCYLSYTVTCFLYLYISRGF